MTATLPEIDDLSAALPATRKSRWLQVVSHTEPRYGGLSSAVPAMATSLAQRQALDVRLAAFCHPGEQHRPAAMKAEEVTFWPTSRASWVLDRKLKTSLANAMRAADGVHVHGLWEQSTAVACSLARRLGKPYVLSAHGMLEPWALAAKGTKKRVYAALMERANVAGAACLHALTHAEAEQYRSFGAPGPIAVVPNAVTLPVDASAEMFLQRFPHLRDKRVVLFLSRLHRKKGLDLLVEAWARVAGLHADAHLVIAGPDDDRMQAALRSQASQRGVGEKTEFVGMLSGAMKWSALCAAEGYVLPSYSEGLSMALLEAMGMGVPVIATRACHMPEILSADAGWEIDATADAVAQALKELLDLSPGARHAKGRNGADLIAARYTPERVAQQMAEVYAFALGGPVPPSVPLLRGGAR